MMTSSDIMERLRKIYVDGVRDWDENYEAYSADLERRVGCLSVELSKAAGSTVAARSPTGDVHYYSFEVAVNAPPDRFQVSVEDVKAADGEAVYLVAYCSAILPLVELRWHTITLDGEGQRARRSFDILDEEWLKRRSQERELSLKALECLEHCGWQLLEPELTEQPAPAGWPWPLPSYDYQDGDYKVRDYIFKGMRDY
jgi:hypothetical protein